MPSNDALGRTPSHIAFKRARSLHAACVHRGCDWRTTYLTITDYIHRQNLTPGTRGKILAAVLLFPKPSTEKEQ